MTYPLSGIITEGLGSLPKIVTSGYGDLNLSIPIRNLSLLGYLCEAAHVVNNPFQKFFVIVDPKFRNYIYYPTSLPVEFPPLAFTFPATWSATNVCVPLQNITLTSNTPDAGVKHFTLSPKTSKILTGYPCPAPSSENGRLLASFFIPAPAESPPSPPPPSPPSLFPPLPPEPPQHDLTWPLDYVWPPDFQWPSEKYVLPPWFFFSYYPNVNPRGLSGIPLLYVV